MMMHPEVRERQKQNFLLISFLINGIKQK